MNINATQHIDYKKWWNSLESQWKKAFNEAYLQKGAVISSPTLSELQHLWTFPALRFAGPTAPYPNMTFELTNMSGIKHMTHVFTLVVIHHKLDHINELKKHSFLRSLFVYNNQIKNIEGAANLLDLEEFYFQSNQIKSLLPLKKLTQLKTIYCSQNKINSLEGMSDKHSHKLQQFYCFPNKDLSPREAIKAEQEYYIKCLKN